MGSLAELVRYRLTERYCLKNQDGEQERKTPSINLWPSCTHLQKLCTPHTQNGALSISLSNI